MCKERVALQRFNDRHNPVMATDPQVISLGNVMGQNNS